MVNKLLLLLVVISLITTGFLFFSFNSKDRVQNQQPTDSQQQGTQKNQQKTPEETKDPFGSPDDENWWLNIQAKAIKTNVVDVTDCKIKPQIVSFTPNQQFTMKNTSANAQRLFLTEDVIFYVPVKGELSVKADFKRGSGAYKVYCNSATPVGVFVVLDNTQAN